MERELPVIEIQGTPFYVDVSRQELSECANPQNTMEFWQMFDLGTHYVVKYDPKKRNAPDFGQPGILVEIPRMAQLDPAGMAAHYGKSTEELQGKTDYELIVNQDLVRLREKGVLPVIDIAGHPFFVDLRMDCLRPKDDFSTMGIQFAEIDDYLLVDERVYRIPYDPGSRSFADIDFQAITEIPKGIVVAEIPYLCNLDPIGYARKFGIDQKDMLRRYPPVAEMKARIVPWSETPVREVIAENRKKQQKQQQRKGRKL